MESSREFGQTTTVGADELVSAVMWKTGIPSHVGRYCIRSVLGEGGFGCVYLAFDEQLERLVAVKVPHRKLVPGPEAALSYLAEARAAAQLDHPNIVPVYDVGSSDDSPCFIVSKFIEGRTLAQQLKEHWPSPVEAQRLVATVALALQHAHERGIVHRDVKPGNILLDLAGRPYVADFGLALRETNFGTGPSSAGTPAYMSPEQARGEGHRVDGRSDVFSLGSVLYELLTRHRPFHGDSLQEMLQVVAEADPLPPRHLDDSISRELERICLKALARRASDRYATAHDLADDLEHFLASSSPGMDPQAVRMTESPGASAVAARAGQPPVSTSSFAPSTAAALKVIPRGLRSFDAGDASFFLSLLPGPRDRDGIPDSVRFWKARIDATDPEETFPVGLLYGPSGCGKSSLVKAGVAPLLGGHVLPLYIEATALGTEARLLAALAKRCPDLPQDDGMAGALASLRRGQSLPSGRKVLIVLDQFEQWLHARRESPEGELAQALRQCDGARVQCLVLVRDDFWMAATRFMGELEVPLVEGHNSSAVDLFPVRHAENVLAAFGRAFGALPDLPAKLGRDHRHFLEQAVAGLAQEGKVICVRLALFAQMMKDRPWTPASLRGVGGALGVGATFLEETFSAPGAPPEHRVHQNAARAILEALLPNSGIDIKGQMRSRQDLLEASGYAARPGDFDDLIRILDPELRLITPTDPEGEDGGRRAKGGGRVNEDQDSHPGGEDGGPRTDGGGLANEDQDSRAGRADSSVPVPSSVLRPPPSALRYYQLAHDYLVPSLRDWLTRKKSETRRGRAELRLAERSALWSGKPENRFLPPWWEWLALRLLTRPRNWTTPERAMMRRAGGHHAAWGLALAAGIVLLLFAGREGHGRGRAQVLQARLLEAATEDLPGIVREMGPYRRWLDVPLRKAYESAEANQDKRRQLHASLGLLPVDRGQLGYLCDRMLDAGPQELLVIRDALQPHSTEASPRLWRILEDLRRLPGERLRAACALASYAPDDPRWPKVSRDVAARLVAENALVLAGWAEALRPVRRHLLPHLAELIVSDGQDAAGRRTITGLYNEYADGLPDAFATLETEASGKLVPVENTDERVPRQRRQATAAVALASLGHWLAVRPLLNHTIDPTVRSYLIDRLGPGGADAAALEALMGADVPVSARRAALLALGEFGEDRLPSAEREQLAPRLEKLYRDDPDGGIHAITGWLLVRWGGQQRLAATDHELARGKPVDARRWYVDSLGQTFVLVPPGRFERGTGPGRSRISVDHGFAIAAREVTVTEFRRFRKEYTIGDTFARTDDCPAHEVTWYDAAAYCNWLSERSGIPKEQWCYSPNPKGQYASGMKVACDFLSRTGYRLPTAMEWEYACRAGSITKWSLGEAEDLLTKYAWCVSNAWSRLHPVGTLRPNDFGLFDMHGNAWEWCQNVQNSKTASAQDIEIIDASQQTFRGGAFGHGPLTVHSVSEIAAAPSERGGDLGFRPARTMMPDASRD